MTTFTAIRLPQGITLEMIWIPSGSFTMGSPKNEPGHSSNETPQHQVTLSEFWMGKYPVNQAQWRAIAHLPKVERELNPDPSRFEGGNRPVEQVNFFDAMEFCARLSQQLGTTYALPSETQWEYACRAGTTTDFHFGDTITTDLVNYDGRFANGAGVKGSYRGETTEVGSFPPNAFGFYDMHGNVREWCLDHYHDTYAGCPTDGSAWVTGGSGHFRMLRGGSWSGHPRHCRCAYRTYSYPGTNGYDFGFRVVSLPFANH